VVFGVDNVNENPVAGVLAQEAGLPENTAAPALVGSVSASDPDHVTAGIPLVFAVVSPANQFSIGAVTSVAPAPSGQACTAELNALVSFDYETLVDGKVAVTVSATDSDGLVVSYDIVVVIANVNEPPVVAYAYYLINDVPRTIPAQTVLGRITVSDPEGSKLTYTFPAAFSFLAAKNNSAVVASVLGQLLVDHVTLNIIVADPEGLTATFVIALHAHSAFTVSIDLACAVKLGYAIDVVVTPVPALTNKSRTGAVGTPYLSSSQKTAVLAAFFHHG
jgi:hypothetical protein